MELHRFVCKINVRFSKSSWPFLRFHLDFWPFHSYKSKNPTSFDLSDFFIHCESNGISSRFSVYLITEGAYHQPQAVFAFAMMIYNGKPLVIYNASPWWYTRLWRDFSFEFETLLQPSENIFFVAFIQKSSAPLSRKKKHPFQGVFFFLSFCLTTFLLSVCGYIEFCFTRSAPSPCASLGTNPATLANKKRTFVYRQRCVFWMMFAFGKWCWLRRVMTASPNDVCLTAHWGKHRIIAERRGATSYLRSKCIISPQAMHHF